MANKTTLTLFVSISYAQRLKLEQFSCPETGSVAEWSKALVEGSSPSLGAAVFLGRMKAHCDSQLWEPISQLSAKAP